jgi:hypothetical protein
VGVSAGVVASTQLSQDLLPRGNQAPWAPLCPVQTLTGSVRPPRLLRGGCRKECMVSQVCRDAARGVAWQGTAHKVPPQSHLVARQEGAVCSLALRCRAAECAHVTQTCEGGN